MITCDRSKITGRKKTRRHKGGIQLIMLGGFLLWLCPEFACSTDFYWPDYRKPFSQEVYIFQPTHYAVNSAHIRVNLPAQAIAHQDNMTFIIRIESKTKCPDGTKFGCFLPYLQVNDAWLRRYQIPVTPLPGQQTHTLQIPCSALRAGENTIKAGFRWKRNWHCENEGCGYLLQKLFLRESLGSPIESSSNGPEGTSEPIEPLILPEISCDSREDMLTPDRLNIKTIIECYQTSLHANTTNGWQDVFLQDTSYNDLYGYLRDFFRHKGGKVWAEYPPGNEGLNLLITSPRHLYGIHVISFTDVVAYRQTLKQGAMFGKHLNIKDMTVLFFIDTITQHSREMYEQAYFDKPAGVTVQPIFVEIGDQNEGQRR